MKSLRTIAVGALAMSACVLTATGQTVQYVTLYCAKTNSAGVRYPIQPNQIVSLVGFDWFGNPGLSGDLPDGTSITLPPFYNQGGNTSPIAGSHIPQMVTGLTNVTVKAPNYSAWATFQITTPAGANVISNYVPADAIVIPASTTGPVQIILESSADLLNWSAANPGTYSASSATNRFFRVRAVHN
jgi:hypothetical protein